MIVLLLTSLYNFICIKTEELIINKWILLGRIYLVLDSNLGFIISLPTG